MPAPSWPPMYGRATGRSPVIRCMSEWQRPAATYRIRTSPSSGSRTSTSMTSHGLRPHHTQIPPSRTVKLSRVTHAKVAPAKGGTLSLGAMDAERDDGRAGGARGEDEEELDQLLIAPAAILEGLPDAVVAAARD